MSVQYARAMSVEQIRFGVHSEKTRLVLDLSALSAFRVFTLADPYRLVVDLPAFEWNAGKVMRPPNVGIISVRHGELQPGVTRLVFDLKGPAQVLSAFSLGAQEGKPERLVVDFAPVSMTQFAQSRSQVFGTLKPEAIPGKTNDVLAHTSSVESSDIVSQVLYGRDARDNVGSVNTQELAQNSSQATSADAISVPKPKRKPRSIEKSNTTKSPADVRAISQKKPLIVIDAGHGGVDPGAIGANKVQEKTVVLALAKALEAQLMATQRYRVMLTRDGDTFIKLRDRVGFARKHDADLFISLHADSIERPNVRGASFYTLSEKASDAQTARLAARENRADLIAGIDLSVEDEEVASILVDLAMRETTNQGKFLANKVLSAFRSSGLKVLENPHRHAGFAVLKAPDIPSILVEAGFMSNRKEANQLNTQAYRERLARALRNGVDVYFRQVQKNQRL